MAPAEKSCPEATLPARRPASSVILPADIESALTRLPDSELRRLSIALGKEILRREASSVTLSPDGSGATGRQNLQGASFDRSIGDRAASPENLTPSKRNAIRATVKAGIKTALKD